MINYYIIFYFLLYLFLSTRSNPIDSLYNNLSLEKELLSSAQYIQDQQDAEKQDNVIKELGYAYERNEMKGSNPCLRGTFALFRLPQKEALRALCWHYNLRKNVV